MAAVAGAPFGFDLCQLVRQKSFRRLAPLFAVAAPDARDSPVWTKLTSINFFHKLMQQTASVEQRDQTRKFISITGGMTMKTANYVLPAIFTLSLFASISAVHGADAAPAIAARSQGSISYVTGGIGLEEKEAMRLLAKQYNLRMVFATTAGEHLADVKVVVRDGKGKVVLDVVSDGPCLLAAVPAGTYKVTADSAGATVTKAAAPGAKRGAALYFHFPVVRTSGGADERRDEDRAGGAQSGCF